jgi:hypothetical protein
VFFLEKSLPILEFYKTLLLIPTKRLQFDKSRSIIRANRGAIGQHRLPLPPEDS